MKAAKRAKDTAKVRESAGKLAKETGRLVQNVDEVSTSKTRHAPCVSFFLCVFFFWFFFLSGKLSFLFIAAGEREWCRGR